MTHKNGTTIEQQIKAVKGEVQAYERSITWHDHQKALDDAVRTLSKINELEAERSELRNKVIELEESIKKIQDRAIELYGNQIELP